MTEPIVEDGRVVVVNYRLMDETGAEIDSSEVSQPISYLHGNGQILPGLERELEGKVVGEEATIVVSPEDGFGPHRQEYVMDVPRSQFDFPVEKGSVVEAETPDGRSQYLQILDVKEDSVTLDGNHPMAGKELHFEITVVSIRDATAEEMNHGHAHELGEECDRPDETPDA